MGALQQIEACMVGMATVLRITYPMAFLQWNSFIFFQIPPRYLKRSVYQHPICAPNIDFASNMRHAIIWNKYDPFDRRICAPFGLNELINLVRSWKQSIDEGGIYT